MTKELGLEHGPKTEIHIDLLRTTLDNKDIKLENARSWWNTFNSLPFTTDEHSKWTEAYKELTYPKG